MYKGDQMFQCMVWGSVHFATLEPAVAVFVTRCIRTYVCSPRHCFCSKVHLVMCDLIVWYYFSKQSMLSSLSDSNVL